MLLWKYLRALWSHGFAFWEGGEDWYARATLVVTVVVVPLGAYGLPVVMQAPPLPPWTVPVLAVTTFLLVAPFLTWVAAQRRISNLEGMVQEHPDARLRLVQDQYLLYLEIENLGADAEFDVRLDISRIKSLPEAIHGFHPGRWLNDEVKVTKTIMEGTAERVVLRSIWDDGGKLIDRFTIKTNYGGMARVLACTHTWSEDPAAGAPPETHVVAIKVSAQPRLRTGPQTCEIEIEGRRVRVISGSLAVPT